MNIASRLIVMIGLCAMCYAPGSSAWAQVDTLRCDMGSVIMSDGATVIHDAGGIFGAPLHFREKDWFLAGGVLVGTIALFTVDAPGRTLAQRNHSSLGDDLFGFGREYGREVYGLSASVGLYLAGLVFKDANARETGMVLFESIAMAGAITTVLKSVLGRSRPYTGEDPTTFHGLQFHTETTSLPSGHTTVAFAVSSVLAGRIKNVFASIALYSAATITAMSRVYHDAHWISDNFLAAAIGTFVGLALVDMHDTESTPFSVRIAPDNMGVMVVWEF